MKYKFWNYKINIQSFLSHLFRRRNFHNYQKKKITGTIYWRTVILSFRLSTLNACCTYIKWICFGIRSNYSRKTLFHVDVWYRSNLKGAFQIHDSTRVSFLGTGDDVFFRRTSALYLVFSPYRFLATIDKCFSWVARALELGWKIISREVKECHLRGYTFFGFFTLNLESIEANRTINDFKAF